MFEHLDDQWPLDNHLADVESVRRRGRHLQLRRWFTQAGVGAVAVLTVAGVATLNHTSDPRRETVVLASRPGGAEAATPTSTPEGATSTVPGGAASASEGDGAITAAGDPGASPGSGSSNGDEPGSGAPGSDVSDPADPGTAEPGTAPGDTPTNEVSPSPSTPPADPDPDIEQIGASADATLEPAAKNANNGASRALRVQNPVTVIAAFDVRGVDLSSVSRATLRLTVCHTPGDAGFCPDATHDWPAGGGFLSASRLTSGWERWVANAGNGNRYPTPDNPRGTGSGVTWNCVTDTDIANEARDCSGADVWNAGAGVEGPGRSSGPLTNAMANGTVIEFDVTADLQAGLGSDSAYVSFFVRKLAQTGAGSATFYSVEGAAAAGNAAFAPQLVITH